MRTPALLPLLLLAVAASVSVSAKQKAASVQTDSNAQTANPDTDDWKFIQAFSPYQNVKKDVDYPPVLFTTSTRDDRVHPGHARKMMAKMSEQGHDVLYYENIEGGHGGAADNGQRAMMTALAFEFLKQKLFPKATPAN